MIRILVLILMLMISSKKFNAMGIGENERFEEVINGMFFNINVKNDLSLADSLSNSKALRFFKKSPQYFDFTINGRLERVNYEFDILEKGIATFFIDSGKLILSTGKYDQDNTGKIISLSFEYFFHKKEDALSFYRNLCVMFFKVSDFRDSEEETIVSLESASFRNDKSKTFRFISFSILKPMGDSDMFSIVGSLR